MQQEMRDAAAEARLQGLRHRVHVAAVADVDLQPRARPETGRQRRLPLARGYEREQLWTPEGAPAEAFYRSRGWERDGRSEWHPWAGLQMVGYARALA